MWAWGGGWGECPLCQVGMMMMIVAVCEWIRDALITHYRT